jgi:hypothetical protein
MLDCGLAPERCLAAWEALDLGGLRAVFISNFEQLASLPVLLSQTAFRGRVFATEPTVQLGRYMLLEAVASGSVPYSVRDVEHCVERMEAVRYLERVDVDGDLRAVAASSGYCLGAANWVLDTPEAGRIVHLAASSLQPRHPAPMDLEPLRGADMVLVSDTSECHAPRAGGGLGRAPADVRQALAQQVAAALGKHVSVLIPVLPAGSVFDLLELFGDRLRSSNHKLFFASPVATGTLSFSNISSEWLSRRYQERIALPEAPFVHGSLVQAGRLVCMSGPASAEFTGAPCVVFAGRTHLADPLFRGFAVLQVEPKLIISSDPSSFFFIENRLSAAEAARVLAEIHPALCVNRYAKGDQVAIPSKKNPVHVFVTKTAGEEGTRAREAAPPPRQSLLALRSALLDRLGIVSDLDQAASTLTIPVLSAEISLQAGKSLTICAPDQHTRKWLAKVWGEI